MVVMTDITTDVTTIMTMWLQRHDGGGNHDHDGNDDK